MSTPESSASTASAPAASSSIQVFIKAPSGKITLDLESLDLTVLELKGLIEGKDSSLPATSQRLIYSGRVLKDEDPLSKYQFKAGNTIHLVKGSKPPPPATGSSSAAQGVPSSFAAGQQIAGNPLAPLMNAENAGALAGFNPFAQMGINQNDPNYMLSMMQDPAVQANMANLMNDPAVVEQMIAQSPELRAMGPQVRQLMQSDQFRQFLTNPDMMRQMNDMMQGMGGGGGAGAFPPPGAFGFGSGAPGSTGATATPPAGGMYNPWASTAPTPSATGAAAQPPAAGAQGAFNPFAALGGGAGGAAGGQAPDFASMMANMRALQGMGGFGGAGAAAPTPSGPTVSPEERYATQLEQLAGMGFHDGQRNVRALLATGGNVEAAVEYLFSNN